MYKRNAPIIIAHDYIKIRDYYGYQSTFTWKEIEYIMTGTVFIYQIIYIKALADNKEMRFPYFSFSDKPLINAIRHLGLESKIKKYY